MFDDIGKTAGEIWHYLEKHEEASVGKLTKELRQTERMVLLGIGWLAREGKLNIEKRQRATYFMLNTASTSDNRENAVE
ncbi:winged helix-turn-helix domain-containing protein [Candidatus Poribacteria bacterium]|nr:winged helix-turn-helix domain-containing protein [Candidatus Poribacteria bacterium]